MAAQKKYLDELRERAVKMVFEIRERDGKGHGELARVLAATDGRAHYTDGICRAGIIRGAVPRGRQALDHGYNRA